MNTPHVVTADIALTHWDEPPLIAPQLVWDAQGRITQLSQQVSPLPPPAHGAPLTVMTAGLINLHTHLAFSGYTPVPRQANMGAWLAQVVRTTRQAEEATKLSPQQRLSLGIQEALRYGTVAVADVAPLADAQAVLKALATAGLAGNVAAEVFHPLHTLNPTRLHQGEVSYQALMQTSLPTGLSAGLSPHSPYNVSPVAWQHWLNTLSPTLVHTHLAESTDETAWFKGEPATGIHALHQAMVGTSVAPLPRGGRAQWAGATAYLQEHGLLQSPLLAAHAVEVLPEEWALLTQQAIGVAHCPRSNLALHGSTLLGDACWQHGRWGLGTDSHLSTPNLDLRAEARLACELHGWQPQQAWYGLTQGGALCLGLEETLGKLMTGHLASFCLWQIDPTHLPTGWQGLSKETNVLANALLEDTTQLVGLWLRGQRYL